MFDFTFLCTDERMPKKNLLHFFYPPMGPLKTCTQKIIFLNITCSLSKVVFWPWCQNMIFSTIKIRLACKIWVLYLQNQASYVNFSFVNLMQNLNFATFKNPEMFLKFQDFWLIFCKWPLNMPSNKWYIATWGQKWPIPWFLMGASEAPSMGATESDTPWEVGLNDNILSFS